jgi:DNA-binding IclR family transcriptional regulator
MNATTIDTSTVLGKALGVLEAFTPADRAVPLADLSRRTGLPKGTLHRVATTLVASGLLERRDGGYRLGRYLFELGMLASAQSGLRDTALPFLHDLCELTHETVHLGIPDGTQVFCVEKINGHRYAPGRSRAGGRIPMHCTALGKALLAFSAPDLLNRVLAGGPARRTPRTIVAPGLLRREMLRVADTGVAYDYEEAVVGLAGVAAPVLGPDGVVAAVAVTGPALRFRPHRAARAVSDAARGLSRALSARGTFAEAMAA